MHEFQDVTVMKINDTLLSYRNFTIEYGIIYHALVNPSLLMLLFDFNMPICQLNTIIL